MHIPTFLNRRDVALPDATGVPTRCIVAENGIFMERRSSMVTTSTRVTSYDLDLARHDEYCRIMCGRIPRVMHRAMLSFFKGAHALHGGEAALVLLYHPQRRTFRWHCPRQIVDVYSTWSGWTAGDVIEYQNPLTLPDGFLNSGDAHLHVGAPTPSAIDVHDDQDGLHIIVGNIGSTPTYHVVFVMDHTRFRIPPESIFDDPQCRAFDLPPRSWLDQIRLRSIQNGQASTYPPPDTHRFGRPTY